MNLYGGKSISKILLNLLNLLIVVGVIMTVKVYYTTFLIREYKIDSRDSIVAGLLLTIGVVCTFLIVLDLKKVVKTLVTENPFVIENVKNLNKIAIECFVICACYLMNILYNISKYTYKFVYIDNRGVHTDTEPIIFFLAGIFILILAAVFKQAIKYKEENDYTI